MVGEGIAPPAANSEPDMRLSPHPAPLSESPCHGYQSANASWLGVSSFCALARTLPCEGLSFHAHEHGTTRCVNSPAMPGNKSLLLTTFSDLSTLLDWPFFLTVPTSAYPGHCPRLSLLRQSSSWLHWVEPTRIIEVSPTCHTRADQEFPRSESSFVAVLGRYYTPGYLLCEYEPMKRTGSPL